MSEKVECPYCEKENWDVHELCPYKGDYQCEFCNKEFHLSVKPVMSVEAFAKEKEYGCPYCDYNADGQQDQKNHRWQEHGEEV